MFVFYVSQERLLTHHPCPTCLRGEQIIRNSNIIRITNIRIRIWPQIETRILFVFVFDQKLGSEYYSYSYSVILKIRILFAAVFGRLCIEQGQIKSRLPGRTLPAQNSTLTAVLKFFSFTWNHIDDNDDNKDFVEI